jgi:hypothetical protein
MLLDRVREWFYWPMSPEYAIPWALGPSLFITLGALGFPNAQLQRFQGELRPATVSGAIIVLGSVLNFTLLLQHTRSALLTWRIAVRPTLGTLLALSALYVTIWGVIIVSGDAVGCAICSRGSTEWDVTLHVCAGAVQVLTSVLLVSAFWKAET